MRTSTRTFLLYLCFFFSGIAGLVYQVVWSRYLTLFLGGTGQAQVIILGTFMGGLALGAWLFGRRADTAAQPLKLYALLEIGIGACGLIYPALFDPIRGLFIALAHTLGLGTGAVTFAAFVICALTILIPTTLMGGTLPVLARYMIESESRIGHHIARLYYLNSFGAVFGSLIGGFLLIPKLGLPYTMYAAAFLNIEVALAAFLLAAAESKSLAAEAPQSASVADDTPPLEPDRVAGPLSAARIALVVIGISGFVSFVYEVAWIRLLTLVLGTSSFSFSIMLAAFIFGITLGSFVLSRKKTEEGYFRILGWCEIAIGLSALLSLLFYHRLPYVLNQWRSMLASEDHAYPLYQFGAFLLCFVAMVLPTVFIGATVPAASRVVARDLSMLGRRIGSVFAINTAGTLLGAFCAGFVLLPHLGIRHMIELAAGLNLLLGLWVVLADRSTKRAVFFRRELAVGLCVMLPLAFIFTAPDWEKGAFTGGAYRMRQRTFSWAEFNAANTEPEVVFYADGKDASIAVTKSYSTLEERDVLSLRINGKPDASDGRDMITQSLVGHLPMLLHPAPKDVLVVGLGSGVTAGAASLYPDANITVIELIPEVIEASKFFRHVNSNVLEQPNVQLVIQDAKTFMQLGGQKYDVIIMEPTNPWIAGVAGLFSEEFLRDARARLRDGGIVLQWVHLYEMEDQAFWSVLRTFNEHYPYSTLFNLGGTDMAIIGSPSAFEPDFARMESTIRVPALAEDLARVGIHGLLPILSMQAVAKNDSPGPYVRMSWTNSDMNPLLEYIAVRSFFLRATAASVREMDRRAFPPAQSGLWIADYSPSEAPSEQLFSDWIQQNSALSMAYPHIMVAWTNLWVKYHPASAAAHLARASSERKSMPASSPDFSAPLVQDQPEAILARARLAKSAYLRRTGFGGVAESEGLVSLLELAAEMNPGASAECLVGVGDVLDDGGDFVGATNAFERALAAIRSGISDSPAEGIVRLRLARVRLNAGDHAGAEGILRSIPADGDGNRAIRNVRHFMLCEILREVQVGKAPTPESNPPIEWFEAP